MAEDTPIDAVPEADPLRVRRAELLSLRAHAVVVGTTAEVRVVNDLIDDFNAAAHTARRHDLVISA
jgi:hypothetical protein